MKSLNSEDSEQFMHRVALCVTGSGATWFIAENSRHER
jgi:hypothetical protein